MLHGREGTGPPHTYETLGLPLQQQTFTQRRKSVRTKPGNRRRLGRGNKQSTLTQVGWISTPRSTGDAFMLDDENEYKEQPPRAKKRRKTTSRLAQRTDSQPTYTQAISGAPGKQASRSAHLSGTILGVIEHESEAENAAPCETMSPLHLELAVPQKRNDCAPERSDDTCNPPEVPNSSSQAINTLSPLPATWNQRNVLVSGDLPDFPRMHNRACAETNGTSLVTATNESSQRHNAADFMQEQEVVDSVTWSRSAGALITPRNTRFIEIPSSQSPDSIMLSSCKSDRHKGIQRSPLHERDVNAWSHRTVWDMKRQSPSPRYQHHSPTQKSKSATTSLSSPQDKVNDSFHKPPVPTRHRSPPELARTTTIADSQLDEVALDLASELSDDGQTDRLEEPPNGGNDLDFRNDLTEDVDGTFYDPVCSALDRDAARFFARTQTQGTALELHVSNSTADDEEQLAGEGDGDGEPQVVSIATPSKQQGATYPVASVNGTVPSSQKHERQYRPQQVRHEKHINEALEVIPSSPPLNLRPSQISTVVSTQPSPVRAPPSPIPASLRHDSPTRQPSVYEDIVTSSPLPFPPWSSPEMARLAAGEVVQLRGRHMVPDNDMHSLTDFSLPPPPPMSSCRVVSSSSSSSQLDHQTR